MGRGEGKGRGSEGKREGRKGEGEGKGREGENDLTHPLSQIPGYAISMNEYTRSADRYYYVHLFRVQTKPSFYF